MKDDFEKVYHEVEKTHFWFKSRRRYIINFLANFPKETSILDIGCSSGILLSELAESGFDIKNLYGVDISENAIHNCKRNGIPNSFVMNAQSIKLEKKFDVIVASDCLEHLENDSKALENWYEQLDKNGILIVFVPALMILWSEHDIVNMHFRRYTRKNLKKNLLAKNFIIEKSSYWNFLLFFPILIYRLISRIKVFKKQSPKGNLEKQRFFNPLLFSLINFENKLLSIINFPIGVSVFCVARKHQ